MFRVCDEGHHRRWIKSDHQFRMLKQNTVCFFQSLRYFFLRKENINEKEKKEKEKRKKSQNEMREKKSL